MKTKFIKIKCMAKNCKVKIIIEVNKVIIDNKEQFEPKEMLNFCLIHKEQFNNKLKEIKQNYTENNLNNKFIKDISTNVVNKYNKKN
ncbi:hypothetical protein [Spiroplasma endosymbiont of Nomada rufipes]|uniref:hypothetical protein n=1 Tax=Spiroplasma endosymbiont of Nomada rufipes TaxID=3077933 RepID=UPI00376F2BDD